MENFISEEHLPFALKEYSQNGNIIFVSQNYDFLEKLAYNLKFLESNVVGLFPKFAFFTNHQGFDNAEFLKNYILSFESQAKITLMHSSLIFMPLPEPDSFLRINIAKGQKQSITEIAKNLVSMGYISTSTVNNEGEFAIRGYILDIATTNEAFRVEFIGNTIEQIKILDCETQRSINNIDKIDIFPNKLIGNFELPLFKARYMMKFQESNEELFHAMEFHPESCDINKYVKLICKNTINIMEILSGSIFLHNFTAESLNNSTLKEFEMFKNNTTLNENVFYYSNILDFLKNAKTIACV